MGIFKKDLPTLGEKQGVLDSWLNAADGKVSKSYILENGAKDLSRKEIDDLFKNVERLTLDELKNLKEKNQLVDKLNIRTISTFKFALQSTESVGQYIQYEPKTNMFLINVSSPDIEHFKRSAVDSFEVIKDGEKSERFSIASATGGALLTGGIGLLAGFMMPKKKMKCSELKLRIYTTGATSVHDISFIKKPINVKSHDYDKAIKNLDKVLEIIQNAILTNTNEAPKQEMNILDISSGIADELNKLMELKDNGILTQDEFDSQKAKLLTK